ncbi:energy transducer TonB [Rheinheimera sp.]|uniref:energy transducer TonB n=1 Tax=Rheinheimera sp. TaxID=1869214 RepID=UPI0023572159|nr:energy transducer TonB [Rheinheimera sp.]
MKKIAILLIVFIVGCSSYHVKPTYKHRNIDISDPRNHDFLVKSTPRVEYPRELAETGFEGYVKVRYDIAVDGTTKNISIVDSDAEEVLGEYAKEAIAKTIYYPRVIDGVPVEVEDMQNKISFCSNNCKDGSALYCKKRSTACQNKSNNQLKGDGENAAAL